MGKNRKAETSTYYMTLNLCFILVLVLVLVFIVIKDKIKRGFMRHCPKNSCLQWLPFTATVKVPKLPWEKCYAEVTLKSLPNEQKPMQKRAYSFQFSLRACSV